MTTGAKSIVTVTVIALWLFALGVYVFRISGHMQVQNSVEEARKIRVQADLGILRTALGLYNAENGFYPATAQGLPALVDKPRSSPVPSHWAKRLYDTPIDPWNNRYIYRFPGIRNPNGYDVFSSGPDGVPDTADDDWGN